MLKSFIKSAAAVILIFSSVALISIYDSEKFAEPRIGYSEEALIPLDSIWEETEEHTSVQTSLTASAQDRTEESTHTEAVSVQTKHSENEIISDQSRLININTATVEELKTLNGIGDVIAARIVEYAQTIGFSNIEEIKNVKGIGEKKYENIKDKITV